MKQENEHATHFNQMKKGLTLSLDIIPDDETVILALDGYLDSMNSDDFKTTAQTIIQEIKSRTVVFDCTDLTYISSTGIGVFVLISTGSSETRDRFFFMGMSASVRQVFETLGFMGFLKTIESLNDLCETGHGRSDKSPKS
jgi:anti-anti-sigma factor